MIMWAPLHMTPPSTESIRAHIRAGRLGAITSPAQGNVIEEGWQFCIDNGAFAGTYPGDDAYLAMLRKLRHLREWCLFAVAPDVPGHHPRTWARSRDMLRRIRDLGFPAGFALQDYADVDRDPVELYDEFDCLFIAGTTPFKLSPVAAAFAQAAADHGRLVHMGRVNSLRRYWLRRPDRLRQRGRHLHAVRARQEPTRRARVAAGRRAVRPAAFRPRYAGRRHHRFLLPADHGWAGPQRAARTTQARPIRSAGGSVLGRRS
ncbi:hypothetical protein [Nonomuraea diastatica]|uniref:hypothetical protein n=1 Tax=Nonomuraea diastatica TaxID=1848329 RepID=UPI001050AEC0|nr:hypothetical protein [Nonomuraea diastatica]